MTVSSPADTSLLEDRRSRLIDAWLECVGRWGLSRTRVDDVATVAGCSRATVYRVFPGGKHEIDRAAVAHVSTEMIAELTSLLATTQDPVAALGAVMARSLAFFRDFEPVAHVLRHERSAAAAFLASDRFDALLARVVEGLHDAVAPLAEVSGSSSSAGLTADEFIEWVLRVVLTQLTYPTPGWDLTDPAQAGRYVRTFLSPGGPVGPTARPDQTRPDQTNLTTSRQPSPGNRCPAGGTTP